MVWPGGGEDMAKEEAALLMACNRVSCVTMWSVLHIRSVRSAGYSNGRYTACGAVVLGFHGVSNVVQASISAATTDRYCNMSCGPATRERNCEDVCVVWAIFVGVVILDRHCNRACRQAMRKQLLCK